MKYKCNKCGEITKSQYLENPQIGSHYSVKCSCGNKGNSKTDFHYKIKGFEKLIEGMEE